MVDKSTFSDFIHACSVPAVSARGIPEENPKSTTAKRRRLRRTSIHDFTLWFMTHNDNIQSDLWRPAPIGYFPDHAYSTRHLVARSAKPPKLPSIPPCYARNQERLVRISFPRAQIFQNPDGQSQEHPDDRQREPGRRSQDLRRSYPLRAGD